MNNDVREDIDIDEPLRLFHTADHACGYWPERQARDLVFDPGDPRLDRMYPMALSWGFVHSSSGRLRTRSSIAFFLLSRSSFSFFCILFRCSSFFFWYCALTR